MPGKRRREPANTTGRIPFVWVEDVDTGHRYDVPQDKIRPGMTPVEGYELNYTVVARRTKFRTDLANEPAAPTRVDQPPGDVNAEQAVTSEQAVGVPDAVAAAAKTTVKRAPGK